MNNLYDKCIIDFKITNGKKDKHEFKDFESAKQVYLALIENLTIKSAKLYMVKGKKKILIEKFTKKIVLSYNGGIY